MLKKGGRSLALAKKAEGTGWKPGNPTNLPEGGVLGREVNKRAVDVFAANTLPVIKQIQASDVTIYR